MLGPLTSVLVSLPVSVALFPVRRSLLPVRRSLFSVRRSLLDRSCSPFARRFTVRSFTYYQQPITRTGMRLTVCLPPLLSLFNVCPPPYTFHRSLCSFIVPSLFLRGSFVVPSRFVRGLSRLFVLERGTIADTGAETGMGTVGDRDGRKAAR
ncbi:hypothetical protein HOY80DRAFT_991864 [Tuber brumale]|nr:hypothetical protein HOY80DRAFT_991864 [Tuber brumale]